MSSIILLEPYRSALAAEGLSSGLVTVTEGVELDDSPSFKIGSNKGLQQRVRELCLFYDDVWIVHNEEEGRARDLEEKGLQVMSALPLEEHGIVKFSDVKLDPRRLEKIKNGMRSMADWWELDKELIETWRPLIASQIVARRKLPDISLFDVLFHHRMGNDESLKYAIDMVPEKYKSLIPGVLYGFRPLGFDFIAFSTLNEIMSTDAIVGSHKANVAIDSNFGRESHAISSGDAMQVVKVLLEVLLEDELRFPIPDSLIEMVKIKSKSEMVSFRSLFNPWLTKLAVGDEVEERRLRKEVKKSILQFRNYPRLSLASNISALLALPVGFMGPIGALASTGLGVTSFGLSKLATRWETKNRWINLCPAS